MDAPDRLKKVKKIKKLMKVDHVSLGARLELLLRAEDSFGVIMPIATWECL